MATPEKTIWDIWRSYESEPGVRINDLCKANGGNLLGKPLRIPGIVSFWHAFKHGLGVKERGNCLGWREGNSYQWWSYQDVYARVRALAGALAKNTLLTRQGCLGIYAGAKPLWLIVALAASSRSLTFVPLYDTLGNESCTYIINQVEMPVLFVDTPVAAKQIILNAHSTPSLRMVITCLPPGEEVDKLAKEKGVILMTLDEFTRDTQDVTEEVAFDEPKSDDICVVMYTSGTTGDPKGVVVTQESMIAAVCAVDRFFLLDLGPDFHFDQHDVALQYLPLAHSYGLVSSLWFLYRGASLGFYGGSVLKMMEDAQILKPTFFPNVPRLMNRIYGKIVGDLQQSPVKSRLFWYAYRKKREMMLKGIVTHNSIWDKLVFHKVQNLLGGNVLYMSAGSAPISPDVLEFWRVVFGVLVLEGYGQTESTAVISLAMGPTGGNVGHPLTCNALKLADAPDCGYIVEKCGKGEVCVKGPNVMKGYFKLPEKTAEALDADGWLHTGDIGEFMPNGTLRIVDRKKHIFKLAQGEYIAPEKVENTYLLCPEVLQVFIDGSPLESYVVAVVVPEPSLAEQYAKRNCLDPKTIHLNEKYRSYLLRQLRAVGEAKKLNSLEQAASIYLTNEPFTTENGLLTPTLKNKRPEMRKFFKEHIDALYKAGPLPVAKP